MKTIVVTPGDDLQTRIFSGRAQAAQEAELAFQVPGLLTTFSVRAGQRVAKGDVIAQLRQEEFEARLKTLQSQLEQGRVGLRTLQAGVRQEERLRLEANVRAAEARFANAQAQYERFAGLIKNQAVSRADYEATETSLRVAQEDLKAAQQSLEKSSGGRQEDIEAQEAAIRGLEAQAREANIQFDDSTLRAPFEGVIAERYVEANQNISPRQPIARIQMTDDVDVAVDAPESIMGSGITADRIVEIIAEFTAAPGRRFPMRIKEIAQVADPMTQTFRIRAGMKSPPDVAVLPGMSATVTLTFRQDGNLDKRLLVPISAISRQSSGEQVAWVVGEDQFIKPRRVKIGEATGGQLVVIDGLKAGDRIAVAGVSFLREGMRVRDLGDALGGAPGVAQGGAHEGAPGDARP